MFLDPSVSARLAAMLSWSEGCEANVSWDAIESSLGIPVPDGLKELCGVFPTGSFGDRMHFYNPVQSSATSDIFLARVRTTCESFRYSREVIPEEFPYSFHPELGGLIPWGYGDQHTYFWRSSAPMGVCEVLYADNHGDGWGSYLGDIPKFLIGVLGGEIRDEILYEEWPSWCFFTKFDESTLSRLRDSWKEK